MPYVMTRDESSLKLKAGAELKHEQGKLPAALKFAAAWVEPELEDEGSEPEAEKLEDEKPKAEAEKPVKVEKPKAK